MIVVVEGVIVLLRHEDGEEVRIGPAAGVADGVLPGGIIALLAANIAHRVDRRSAAEHPARAIGADGPMLRYRFILPHVPVMDEDVGESRGDMDERIAIGLARLDECDRRVGVLGQIARHYTAGCTSTDDHEVVAFLGHAQSSSFAVAPATAGNPRDCLPA